MGHETRNLKDLIFATECMYLFTLTHPNIYGDIAHMDASPGPMDCAAVPPKRARVDADASGGAIGSSSTSSSSAGSSSTGSSSSTPTDTVAAAAEGNAVVEVAAAEGVVSSSDGIISSGSENEVSSTSPSSSPSSGTVLVSVIMPVHNAAAFLDESIRSVMEQTYRPLELVCFDDISTDNSMDIIESWRDRLTSAGVRLVVGRSPLNKAKGPGFARNNAYAISSGEYICHLDADDIMAGTRVEKQLELALTRGKRCLIGANFDRIPEGSTPYYTEWINGLTEEGLLLEQYRECTVICPTWFMHRDVFLTIQSRLNRVNGAYLEEMPGILRVPEDTYFFMDHLELGGGLAKVPEVLVTYRYTPGSWCTGTSHADLQVARLPYLQRRVLSLPNWKQFTIWGYGKDGRKFITRLPKEIAAQVVAFCDVDVNKIGMTYFIQSCRKHVPVISYTEAKPPMIICVASKRAQGGLEENIRQLNMTEGVDYYHFC